MQFIYLLKPGRVFSDTGEWLDCVVIAVTKVNASKFFTNIPIRPAMFHLLLAYITTFKGTRATSFTSITFSTLSFFLVPPFLCSVHVFIPKSFSVTIHWVSGRYFLLV